MRASHFAHNPQRRPSKLSTAAAMPAVNSKPDEAPAHTEAPAPAWPVPACWRFLYPRRPFPTLAWTHEQQVVLLRAHGVGLLGLLPDPRDDPELFQFSCRLSINTLQALLLPVVYPQGVYTYPALLYPEGTCTPFIPLIPTWKEKFHASLRELQGNTAFCAALDGHDAE